MKLPYSWLKEFVPALPPAAELEPILAGMGLPLEGLDELPAPPAGVLLASVTTAAPLEGTALTHLTLDVGQHGTHAIASGAPNAVGLPAGTMLALVSPGTTLGDTTYGVRAMQGVESWGMAASARELGLGENASGLLLFPAGTAAPGTPMSQLWAADVMLDIEVTPNRADVLSVYGLARDLAAVLRLPLLPAPRGLPVQGEGEIEVRLPQTGLSIDRDPARKVRTGCDHFAARTVGGLRNGPSPLWLQRRLTLCGARSIDALVDVSNYVMFELGQPTAFYDRRDVINDRLVVGFGLRQGEMVRDLMGGEHQVGGEDLLIRDGRQEGVMSVADAFATAQQPREGASVLGIAGIMGGDHGRVRPDTADVVIESAHFDPVLLRRTSTRLGLKTDAVFRYERGVDPQLAPHAADRVAELLGQLGGAVHPGATVVGQPELPSPLTLDADYARRLLGMPIATPEMVDSLTRLGCTVSTEGETLTVTPPSWRVDLQYPEDLIEEVARLHGYHNLPETLPNLRLHSDNVGAGAASSARRELKRQLSGLGAQEVVTYTFTSDEEAAAARSERPSVRLRNPMTSERTSLRTALYPSLLRAAQAQGTQPQGAQTQGTQTQGAPSSGGQILIFETGHVFPASGEAEHLGLLMRGPLAAARGQGEGDWKAGVPGGYPVFRGLLEALAGLQGAHLEVRQLRGDAVPGALHPGVAGELIWNGQPVGWLGALHPEVAQAAQLAGDTYLLEARLPLPGRDWQFRDPSRAPVAWRDLAVVVPGDVSYGEVAALLRAQAGPLLESLEPFDVYSGAPIPDGQRSVAVRLSFRGERTLTDAEVDPIMAQLMAAVRAQGWDIRDR